jgi:hypothetical protein
MKLSQKTFLASKNHLPGLLAISLLGLSVMPGLAQINSVIYGFGPVFNINPIGGPGGDSVSLNTQISYGNFNGFGNEYLYQYQVTVNAGSPAIDGFNLWTVSQAAFNAGGNTAGNAITLATAANANNLIAVAPGGAQDPGGAGPGASVIPATPAGAPGPAPFNNIPAFVPAFSYGGNAIAYTFLTPNGNLNQNFNFDTTVADPNNPAGAVGGLNWGFTYWNDGTGDSLLRWFSVGGAGGGNSLAAGQTMTFDVFSPFGPVSAGAFPDPQGPEAVDVGFDDVNGLSTLPALDSVDTAPEPSTWSLLAVSALTFGVLLRRKSVQA